MAKQGKLPAISQQEFADKLLVILQSDINQMLKHPEIPGVRCITKVNKTADQKRYTVSIDIGRVYKFLVNPALDKKSS